LSIKKLWIIFKFEISLSKNQMPTNSYFTFHKK